jgi:small subunit ribosomal protein S12
MRLQQLFIKPRVRRIKIKKAKAFGDAPHRQGVIYKIATMSPRKPNSAKIPGIGEHFLQAHSVVFVRGHGPKDSPGINYHLIRGLCDFIRLEAYGRQNRRSKFGVKKLI